MPGTTRHTLDEEDKRLIVWGLDVLVGQELANPGDCFKIQDLKRRIVSPKKGRPYPPSMENLSKVAHGESLKSPKRVDAAHPTREAIIAHLKERMGDQPTTREDLLKILLESSPLLTGELADVTINGAIMRGDIFESKPGFFRRVGEVKETPDEETEG